MKKKLLLPGLVILLSCNGGTDKPAANNSNTTSIPEPRMLSYNVLNVYPHDTSAFTQGLIFYKGKLYESTGLLGKSTLRSVNYKTGQPIRTLKLANDLFAEGLTILRDTVYQLTYQNHQVLVYNLKDFSLIRKMEWSREGWGLTDNGTSLIISEGSDKLYFVRPWDLKLEKIVSVTDNLGPVNNLNELEYVNGLIYANRWQYEYIDKIDPNSGQVVSRIHFNDILKKFSKMDLGFIEKNPEGAVLNGVAWDSASKRMFITGKLWPNLFEVQLSE